MQATHSERLNRWFLAKRSKFTVELTEQREVRPRDAWKHEEHT